MYITNENKLLGPPRLTQVRVASSTCIVPPLFKNHFRQCYAYFDREHENKESFGYKNSSAWHYQYGTHENDVEGVDYIRGRFGLYPTNSFGHVLSVDKASNKATIKELYDGNWIDRATRAIIVEFSVYNANLDMLSFAQ